MSEELTPYDIIFVLAVGLFDENIEAAKRWLDAPGIAFEGKTPTEYAQTPEGLKEVIRVIHCLEHGVLP